jgi:hypothetical protein
MLGLKLEIQELKKKIGELRNQGLTGEEDRKFSEYYVGKKIRQQS